MTSLITKEAELLDLDDLDELDLEDDDESPIVQEEEEEEEQKEMAGGEHGEIASILIYHLGGIVYPQKLGRIFDGQTSFRLSAGKPPRRIPDVAFVKLERMPHRITGSAPFAPDLAVEIVSQTDLVFDLENKIIQYLASGVRLIWIIYPVSQTIEVYRLPDGMRSLRLLKEDELDGENIVPGFKLKISELFEDLLEQKDELETEESESSAED